MNEQSADSRRGKRFAWVGTVVGWAFRNARIAAAFCGGIGTATVLVFNAGADYQGVKSQVEANRIEIQLLQTEVHILETALLRQPDKGISP